MSVAASYGEKPAAPVHVAIIMDGNGRWAKARGLPRITGHRQGAEALRRILRHCRALGIAYLTIYAFSSENWKRPRGEVEDLMGLLHLYLNRELPELEREGVRMRFIGDRKGLPADVIKLISDSERRTGKNLQLTVTVALNYGSRDEIVRAARRVGRAVADGQLRPDDIDETVFARELDSSDLPDPDLLIRTSGEQRLSNFLLWQSAYTELVFSPVLWPDFGPDDLDAAISEFHRRERRYGASSG